MVYICVCVCVCKLWGAWWVKDQSDVIMVSWGSCGEDSWLWIRLSCSPYVYLTQFSSKPNSFRKHEQSQDVASIGPYLVLQQCLQNRIKTVKQKINLPLEQSNMNKIGIHTFECTWSSHCMTLNPSFKHPVVIKCIFSNNVCAKNKVLILYF